VLVQGAAYGNLEWLSDGTFTYLPLEGFTGTDSFRFFITDGETDGEILVVSIDVIDESEATDDELKQNADVIFENVLHAQTRIFIAKLDEAEEQHALGGISAGVDRDDARQQADDDHDAAANDAQQQRDDAVAEAGVARDAALEAADQDYTAAEQAAWGDYQNALGDLQAAYDGSRAAAAAARDAVLASYSHVVRSPSRRCDPFGRPEIRNQHGQIQCRVRGEGRSGPGRLCRGRGPAVDPDGHRGGAGDL
jgi:hypothetical protein